jgi:hypothetical protein
MVALSIDFNEDHYNAFVQASGNPRHCQDIDRYSLFPRDF